MLKPALARGELHVVGATTLDEYRKHVEKDPALERRFQPVLVGEPSVADTIAILRGLKEKYEVHHGVRITDNALVAAATLSDRYIGDRFLPGQGDRPGGRGREPAAHRDRQPARRRSTRWSGASSSSRSSGRRCSRRRTRPAWSAATAIEQEISELREKSAGMKAQWQAEKQAIQELQAHEGRRWRGCGTRSTRPRGRATCSAPPSCATAAFPSWSAKLAEHETRLHEVQKNARYLKEEVDAEDIAEIVAKWTGIPVTKMLESDRQRLTHLEDELGQRVVGQHAALAAVANAVRRSRAGLQDRNRPTGSFIFLGPTGVGKTETARALAEFLFDDERAMVRLDMSEYMEKHSVARMIGAPPGYVGYEEGGQLTEAVRRRPYSVILFDEIEKAHPDVFNLLLQILDDGRLTDSQGRVVDFRNTVIIMTSNIGSAHIVEAGPSVDEASWSMVEAQVREELRRHFRPEFLNRVDDIIVFRQLTEEDLGRIVDLQLAKLDEAAGGTRHRHRRARPRRGQLLVQQGYDPVYGARPLKRVIQRLLQNPLALAVLEGDYIEGDTIVVRRDGDALTLTQGRRGAGEECVGARPRSGTSPAWKRPSAWRGRRGAR